MFSGLDPNKVAEVQKKASGINAEVRIMHKEGELRLKFIPSSPESAAFVKTFVPTFATNMASQLSMCFGITGEIIDVGKE